MEIAFARFQAFARSHDDIVAFHATFLVLTFLAAALLNLGFFAIIILAHMTLDFAKYFDEHAEWSVAVRQVLRESLPDILLLLIALVFSVYLHHSTAIVTLSGFLKVEVSLVRFIATLVPRIAMLNHFVKTARHFRSHLHLIHSRIAPVWATLERFYVGSIALCLLLLLFAGPILHVDNSVIRWVVLWELVPWYV